MEFRVCLGITAFVNSTTSGGPYEGITVQRFACQCRAEIFFDNTWCVSCGRALGYLPDLAMMSALEPVHAGQEFMAGPRDTPRQYRMCVNYAQENVCNWMIPVASDALFCRACALNEIIPDLSQPAHRHYWAKIEAAKRRMLVTLNQLGLPVIRKTADQPQGLVFKFLADTTARSEFTHPILGEERVRTGHAHGVITINLAEADDVARTRRRE